MRMFAMKLAEMIRGEMMKDSEMTKGEMKDSEMTKGEVM